MPRDHLSPKSVDTPKITDETTATAPKPGPNGTYPEPTRHRNPRTAENTIDSVSICTVELSLYHSSAAQYGLKIAGLPGVLIQLASQVHRRDKLQSKTARPANTRDTFMIRVKHKNVHNRNQDYLASPEPRSFTRSSHEYQNTTEKARL